MEKKIKILLINQQYFPEIASGQWMTDLAEYLGSKKDFIVTVVAGQPSYVQGLCVNQHRREIRNNVMILRVPTTKFNKKAIISRLCNWISYYILCFIKCLFLPKYELVLFTSYPPFIGIVALMLKLFKGSKIICRLLDIYPDIAEKVGVIKNKYIIFFFNKISLLIYNNSDKVIVLGECMKNLLVIKGVPEHKIVVIRDWANGNEIFPIKTNENHFREEYKLSGKFIVLYSGNMGLAHEFEVIKECMKKLSHKNEIFFLFIGDGIKKRELQQFVVKNRLKNILFLPYQPREKLIYSLNVADVHLLSMRMELKGIVVPSKIYSCMASGKPVLGICPEGSEVSHIINYHNLGFVVKNGEELKQKILKLYKDPDLRKEYGYNARNAFLNYFDQNIAINNHYLLIKEISGVYSGQSSQ